MSFLTRSYVRLFLSASAMGLSASTTDVLSQPQKPDVTDKQSGGILNDIFNFFTGADEPGVAEAPILTEKERIRDSQFILTTLGYDTKGYDGVAGPNTKKAVEHFQHDYGLPVTGELDEATQQVLLAEIEATHPDLQLPSELAYANPAPEPDIAVSPAQIWRMIERGENPSVNPLTLNNKRALVVIDLGHNAGGDKGATSPYTSMTEPDVVDPIGKKLGEIMQAQGYDVIFPRAPGRKLRYAHDELIGPASWSDDEKLNSRAVRGAFAYLYGDQNGYKDIFFISLHANIWVGAPKAGAELLVGSSDNADGKLDFGRPAIDPLSIQFARSIASAYRMNNHPTDIRTADLGTMENFDARGNSLGLRVGALLELGYLNNADEAAILKQMARKPDQVARQIAQGIINFHRAGIDVAAGPKRQP